MDGWRILILVAACLFATPSWSADYAVDFERPASATGFSEDEWRAYGFYDVAFVSANERAWLDSQVAHGGKQSLKIFFPKGSVGPAQGGYQASLQLEPAAQYFLSYRLRFDRNFSWGNGSRYFSYQGNGCTWSSG